MTAGKLFEILDRYEAVLAEVNLPTVPREKIDHILGMLPQMRQFAETGHWDKCMRWLGFVQGVLWEWNIYTIDELKAHNMPAGAIFSKEA